MAVLGIDVSHANGGLNWKAVARSGKICFAYAKATEGATWVDPLFRENRTAIAEAGLLRGAYHFFRPARSAAEQAAWFLSAVKDSGNSDLPPMVDLEETSPKRDEWTEIAPQRRAAPVLEWLERIEQAVGKRPIVYTRRNFVEAVFGSGEPLAAYPLWIAHYTRAASPSLPQGYPGWTLWQYSDRGRVEGVVSNLDMNRYNASLSELRAQVGISPPPFSAPSERQ